MWHAKLLCISQTTEPKHKLQAPCAVFGCNNDRLFLEKYTVKDHISNNKPEKGDHYYIQTGHKDLLSHYNLILRKL